MQSYEADNIALSAAVLCACEGTSPTRAQVAAAKTSLLGRPGADAFAKKCAEYPLYANTIALLSEPEGDDCSVEGLCALHKALFNKEDAGEIRTTALERTGGAHADPKILRGSLKNVLTKLSQLEAAPQIAKADFAALLAAYDRELIILAPFPYGNGIVRRVFLGRFCRTHGFRLSFASATKTEFGEAEDAAFMGDDPQPIFSLLIKCLNYGQEERKKAPALPSLRRKERSKPATEPPALKTGVYHEKRPTVTKSPSSIRAQLMRVTATLKALEDEVAELQKILDAAEGEKN